MARPRRFAGSIIDESVSGVVKSVRDLRNDIVFLMSRDLPETFVLPARGDYADDGSYRSALNELRRLRRFALVRQALIKHEIRDSLGRRIGILLVSGGPFSLLLGIGVAFVWLRWLAANPQVAGGFRPNCWHFTLIPAMPQAPGPLNPSMAMQTGRDLFGSLRAQSLLLRDRNGSLVIPDRSALDPQNFRFGFSNQELDAIHAELLRRRWIWRVRFFPRFLALALLLTWTLWTMLCEASSGWPFR